MSLPPVLPDRPDFPRGKTMLPIALRSVLVAGLFTLNAAAQSFTAPQKLGTFTENYEGQVADAVAPRQHSGLSSRLWLAQARVRTAFNLTNRQRMHAEDSTFSSSLTNGQLEHIVALEFNDSNGRLYTLTKAGLYREETTPPASPAAPGSRVFLNFTHNPSFPGSFRLDPGEEFQDLKVWAASGSNRVFLLTSHRIISVVDNGTAGLALGAANSWSVDMYPPSTHATITSTTNDANFNSLAVNKFTRLRLFKEHSSAPLANHLVAAVLANTSGYPIGGRDQPTVVLLCDLGANSTDVPSFDSDPASGAGAVNYAYYLSAPLFPGGGPFNVEAHNVYGLDAFADPSGAYRGVYLAGKQTHVPQSTAIATSAIREVDVGGKLPIAAAQSGQLALTANHTITIPNTPGVFPSGDLLVRNVLADDLAPRSRVFAVTNEGFHSHLIVPPPPGTQPFTQVTADQPMGKGALRDLVRTQQTATYPILEIVVVASTGITDHILKTVDVTPFVAATSAIPLVPSGGSVYSMSSADGGVIIPHSYVPPGGGTPVVRDDVYLPTFAGVVKFEPDSALVYRSSAASFQPAVSQGDANFQVHLTEHIEYGKVGDFTSNRDVLFTASGLGDVLVYRTNENNAYAVLQGKNFVPDATRLLNAYGWIYPGTTERYYGNDVAFLDLDPASANNSKYVLVDITRQSPQTGDWHVGLLAYEWDQPNNAWRHVASSTNAVLSTLGGGAQAPTLATTIAISPDKQSILVGHQTGFFTVKQDLATNTLQLVSSVNPTLAGQRGAVKGIVATNTRIFAFVDSQDNATQPSEVRVYEWDSTTAQVTTNAQGPVVLSSIPNTQFANSAYPTIVRSFRARFDPVPGTDPSNPTSGDVYFACEWGVILKVHWSGGNTLTWTNWWRSGYEHSMQDCRLYNLQGVAGNPRAILAVKDTEGFALVKTVP